MLCDIPALAPGGPPGSVARMKFAAAGLILMLSVGSLFADTPAAKPTPGPVKPPVKKEEPMGVIEGTTLNRSNGTFLGLTLVEGKYKLTFYDKKKKPVAVDVDRAIARWPNVHGPGDHQTVLISGGATYLLGQQFVRGPYAFKLRLLLMKGEGETATVVESYVVDFKG